MKLEIVLEKFSKLNARYSGTIRVIFDEQMKNVKSGTSDQVKKTAVLTSIDLSGSEEYTQKIIEKKPVKTATDAKAPDADAPVEKQTDEATNEVPKKEPKKDIIIPFPLRKATSDKLYQLDYLVEPENESLRREKYDCGNDFFLELARLKKRAILNIVFTKNKQMLHIEKGIKLSSEQANAILRTQELLESETVLIGAVKFNRLNYKK